MFATRIKGVPAVVLVVGLAVAGAAGLLDQTRAAEQLKGSGTPAAKKDQKDEKGQPAPKGEPAPGNAKTEQKVLTPEEAVKLRSKEKVTVQFKVAAVQDETRSPGSGFGPLPILLKDGGKFAVALLPPATTTIMRLGIEPGKHFSGRVIRVTGIVQPVEGERPYYGQAYYILVEDLNQAEFSFIGDPPR